MPIPPQLYRCCVIYSMNLWVIAFSCLMYMCSFGMHLSSTRTYTLTNVIIALGIVYIYQGVTTYTKVEQAALPYYSILLSLNILATSMIVIRLILHARNTRNALGMSKIGGLCKTIITMLVESCALYAVNLALVIGPMSARYPITNFFGSILPSTQVRVFPQLRLRRVV